MVDISGMSGRHRWNLHISDCYEKRNVIITTNLEFSKWNGIFFDDVVTSAILDRLIHHCHLVVLLERVIVWNIQV